MISYNIDIYKNDGNLIHKIFYFSENSWRKSLGFLTPAEAMFNYVTQGDALSFLIGDYLIGWGFI